jgi:phage repressor protein C with HTH and peptisase S24 domain
VLWPFWIGPESTQQFSPDYLGKLTRSKPGNLAIISVKGESMALTLHDDDIVMLDTAKTNLDYDGLFVLRFGETLHVKRVTRSPRPAPRRVFLCLL